MGGERRAYSEAALGTIDLRKHNFCRSSPTLRQGNWKWSAKGAAGFKPPLAAPPATEPGAEQQAMPMERGPV